MPTLSIDNRIVEVPHGTSVLNAARSAGIEIPTLCHMEGLVPATSCMLCVVKVRGQDGLRPSCATLTEDGMFVESQTDQVHQARRTGLELLLSDHLGDCLAPCQLTCPARMEIPLMIRQIAAGQLDEAIATVKRDIALPAVLGRICPAPCESGCRRKHHDAPVAICLLKRYLADADLAKPRPYLPVRRKDTHKGVAIIGAGAAGLGGAFHLRAMGHACTVFDAQKEPGGAVRYNIPQDRLPREVLNAEVAVIRTLGARFRMGERIGEGGVMKLDEVRRQFDAVLLAVGKIDRHEVKQLGLETSRGGIAAGRGTYATNIEGVFAAGNATHPNNKLAVRSLADGKQAAIAIDQYLLNRPLTGPERPFNIRIGKLTSEELEKFAARASASKRIAPGGGLTEGLTETEARCETARCLHCDCLKTHTCRLRQFSQLYHADPYRYPAERRTFELHDEHPDLVYEPGKCIACGLCVRIAQRAGEPLGLTFIGRGFNVRVGVPFNETIAEALQKSAADCIAACPTAALAWKNA